MKRCWCGSTELTTFDGDYDVCAACGSLLRRDVPDDIDQVTEDESGFYGEAYWYGDRESIGQPDVRTRSELDLGERCIWWLRDTLRYVCPPGAAVDVGCGHGGFTALLRLAGFEATGLELSPAIAALATETFGVPTWSGHLREQEHVTPGSLDLVTAMDVVEHVPDPVAFVRDVAQALAPEGVFALQMPRRPDGMDRRELDEREHRFLQMMIPEHLTLFTERGAGRLLRRAGFTHLAYTAPIFPDTDMFVLAARRPLVARSQKDMRRDLLSRPQGRIAWALLEAARDRDHARLTYETHAGIDNDHVDQLRHRLTWIRSRRLYQGLVAAGPWRGVDRRMLRTLEETAPPKPTPPEVRWADPRSRRDCEGGVAIDLTPLLPGGANGGAKHIAVALVPALAQALAQEDDLPKRMVLLTSAACHEELAELASASVRLLPAGEASRLNDVHTLLCPMGMTRAWHCDAPVVTAIYDLQYKSCPDFFPADSRAHRELMYQRACRDADVIVTISNYARDSDPCPQRRRAARRAGRDELSAPRGRARAPRRG